MHEHVRQSPAAGSPQPFTHASLMVLDIGNDCWFQFPLPPLWGMSHEQTQQKSAFVLKVSSWPGCRADQLITASECSLINIFYSLASSLHYNQPQFHLPFVKLPNICTDSRD